MLLELRDRIRSGQVSAVEVLDALTRRIEASEPALGAYLSWDAGAARAAAAQADPASPLAGLPVGIKDAIAVSGHPLSCASRMLDGFVSPYTATVVQRLAGAGGVPFGRLNMDEFAMGATGLNSARSPTRNPRSEAHVPGGSSSGSAAAVAAGTALAALGSDTGGSIRQPAGFCGVVGLKPTYGRFSRSGLTAFASSLEQIGPMTSTVADAALLFDLMAGFDPLDSTSHPAVPEPTLPGLDVARDSGLRGLRIGVPREHFADGLDAAVRAATEAALAELEKLGATLVEISLPRSEYAVATYYTLACAEASANLARFDGVRYGHRASAIDSLDELYARSRSEGFGLEVQRRILIGTFVLSSGHYDAWYLQAQKVRTRIREDFDAAFADCELIAGPVAPTTAFRIGADTGDALKLYLADIFTVPANLAGLPALALPCGEATDAGGTALPVGLQLLAPALQERRLLHAAAAFEAHTPWRRHFAAAPLL